MYSTVRQPSAIRDNTRRDGRQSEEPLRNDAAIAAATVAAKQQQHRRTATHADVAAAGKRDSHLSTTADANAHTAATAAGAVPAASATAMGKFWRCVRARQPDGHVWRCRTTSCPREHHGATLLTPRGRR